MNGTVYPTMSRRTNGGRWVSLGIFEMPAGDDWFSRRSCSCSSAGKIIADAVRVVER